MSGIDLIPASYRQLSALRRIGHCSGIALAVMLALFAPAWAGLQWQLRSELRQLQIHQSEAEQAAGLRRQIDQLVQQKKQLEHQVNTLAVLRGDGQLHQVAQAIDASLNPGVWLTSLRYLRKRDKLSSSPEKDGQQRTQLIVRSDGSSNEAWALYGMVEIQGAALDYGALANFMQALSTQPGIAEARFLNSNLHSAQAGQSIEFSVSITLLAAAGSLP